MAEAEQQQQPPQQISLVPLIKTTKVSSVLNGSREYGKQNLFDGAAETCWNSDQGTPQYVQLSFTRPVCIRCVSLTFQGGFVGKSAVFSATTRQSPKKLLPLHTWEPQDDNIEQRFDVTSELANYVTNIRILFPESTDFFGRITLYKLDVEGWPADEENNIAKPNPAAEENAS